MSFTCQGVKTATILPLYERKMNVGIQSVPFLALKQGGILLLKRL